MTIAPVAMPSPQITRGQAVPQPAPIPSYGFGSRLKNAVQAFAAAIFSPQVPPAPGSDTQAEGARQWEYRPGYNLVYTPRASEGLTPFQTMRSLVEVSDMARICIIYRAEEMAALDWSIVPRDPKHPPSDAYLSEAKEWLERPDGVNRWDAWLKMVMEEVLTIDALSIYPQRNRRGDVLTLDLIAGDTVRPLIDGHGRIPQPPTIAYQQILYGRPFWEGTTDDLIYAPKNPRVNSAYGRSPIEEILLTINRSLARQSFDYSWYRDGNIPDAMVPAPAEMGVDQIETLQDWFDNVVNMPANRRKVHFVPSPTGRLQPFLFKQPVLDTSVEEFLDMRTMAALGVEPQEIGFTSKVNKSTAQLQENAQIRRRQPTIRFLSGLVNYCLDLKGYPLAAVQFTGDRPEEDKLAQAQVDQIYIQSGVIHPEEVRKRQNLGTSDLPRFIVIGNSLAMLPSIAQSVPREPAEEDEDIGDLPPEEAEAVQAPAGVQVQPTIVSAVPPPAAAPSGGGSQQDAAAKAAPSSSNAQRAFDAPAAYRELRDYRRWLSGKHRAQRAFNFHALPEDIADAVQQVAANAPEAIDAQAWAREAVRQAEALLAERVQL